MYTYQPLLHLDDIRIIALQPRNISSNGSIHVSISVHKLEHTPPYEALSYVWGDQSETVQITADSQTMNIGRNLHGALMRLRQDETVRTFWVDAVCIDQQDVPEKSHQVSRMRDIFARARSTIMWVGEENDEGKEALKALQDLPGLLGRAHQQHVHTMLGDKILAAIDWLMLQTYFSRSWITQEVVVSSHAVLMCGSVQLNFDDLLGAFSKVVSLQDRGMNRALGLVSLGRWREMLQGNTGDIDGNREDIINMDEQPKIDEDIHLLEDTIYSGLRLGNQLLQQRAAHEDDDWEDIEDEDIEDEDIEDEDIEDEDIEDANDEDVSLLRKMLVAVLEIRERKLERKLKSENIRKMTEELDLVNLLINDRNKGATDPRDKVFALLGISRTSGKFQLETDYSKTIEDIYTTTARQLIQRDDIGLRILSCSQPSYSTRALPSWVPDWSEPWHGGIKTRNKFYAGGTLKPCLYVDASLNSLSIRGLRVGTIINTGGTSLNKWEFNPWRPTPVEAKALSETIQLGLQGDYPFTGESYPSVFLEVITTGCWKSVSGSRIFRFQELSLAGDFQINPFNIDAMKWREILGRISWSDGEWDIFQSEMGYLGLGPASILPGDIFCIFGSAQVPFILRHWEGHGYKLVGECYVHGVMHGEATKDVAMDQLEEFVLW